jgi:hypothetical protein
VAIEVPSDCRELLIRQRGVIARRQALNSGLGADSVETLLRTGRWRRLQRGVYAAFTGEPSREGILWAAVLRAGPSAEPEVRTRIFAHPEAGRPTFSVTELEVSGTPGTRLLAYTPQDEATRAQLPLICPQIIS